jgi:pimeloyl-ACP methyl ester carboxylesterase
VVTLQPDVFQTVEEPLWFGPEERPLFGWLTTPVGGLARGGILCAPPIGREARAGRRAMKTLALALASRGFVTFRFDYDGTGDSSGEFNDVGRDEAWVESVTVATKFLRSLGLDSVSAVGMRLGATLIGVAADRSELNLSSVVLWDPCESGRSYLRELNALEAIRRNDFRVVAGASVETSEYVFSPRASDEIRQLSLSKTTLVPFAERTLVMARSDRAVPTRLRNHLSGKTINWQSTNQQSSLLDADPSWSVLPDQTIDRIVRWFCDSDPTFSPFEAPPISKDAVVVSPEGGPAVCERIVELGSGRLFGIVTAPMGDVQGPLIVMFNVANEEHTGPSRLWVELSRRWAQFGFRSVRFDLLGLGDSPNLTFQTDTPFFIEGWLNDIIEVTRELLPDDPSNSVFIGLCSGAYWAIEAALALQARGVCALNPPVYIDYLHSVKDLEGSRFLLTRKLGSRSRYLVKRPWIAAAAWHVLRPFMPSDWSVDLFEKLHDDDIDVLLLYSVDEVWPFRDVPYFRSIDVRRLRPSRKRVIEFVPGLDHGMHIADGRIRAVEILDRYILEHIGGITPSDESHTATTERS